MTAAIGQKFSKVPAAGSSPGGAARRPSAEPGQANAFRDLVAGNRGAQAAPTRSGEAKVAPGTAGRDDRAVSRDVASPPADKHVSSRARHIEKNGDDDSTDDRTGGGNRRDATRPDDAPPLRDRLPLLVTLNALGHHGAEPASKPEGGAPASTAADAGVGTGGHQPASKETGGPSGAQLPDNAGQQTASFDLARIPSVTGEQPVSATARSLAPRNTADGPAGMAAAMPTPTGPVVAPGDGTPPDGQDNDGDESAGSAKTGRRASLRDEPSTDSASRNGAERRASGPVTVAADRSFPAPAAHPLSPTTARVIETLAAAGAQTPAGPVSQHPQAASVAHPAHVLQIQLHPAELGMVTASLRMTGQQLSIELKPETAEAYRRLSSDSDAITRSLKKLGLDVDVVTVMQPSIAIPPAARIDAGNQSAFVPGRDTGQFQPGTSGGSGAGSGGQQPGRNRNHDGQAPERPAPAHRQRAGGTLFI
jgi:chemotaxis protein MotD